MATACYVPQYLTGSFKGVEFEVLDAGSEHGRRGAEGEFPFGETTAYADLGRRIRRYSISGRFAENSHIADSERLRIAVETPGPGILVHPTRGVLTVACSSLKITDKPIEEQGVTYFDAEFVEGNIFGIGLILGGFIGGIDLTGLLGTVTTHFLRDYAPDTSRWYQAGAVVATGGEAIKQIANEYQQATATAQDQKVWQTLADFRVIEQDPFVVRDPNSLILAIKNGMTYIDSAAIGDAKIGFFKDLVNWASKTSALTGESYVSQNAIYSAVRILAAGYIVRGITETTTTTLDAALAQYDLVSQILEEEAVIARDECNDPRLFLGLRDFIITVQKTLLTRAYELPALVEYKFPGGVHSLVAAWEIFGDAKRFADIESRNPQFLPWVMGPTIVASSVTS